MTADIPPEAMRAYRTQKHGAKRRGTEMRFTLKEWWAWGQIDALPRTRLMPDNPRRNFCHPTFLTAGLPSAGS